MVDGAEVIRDYTDQERTGSYPRKTILATAEKRAASPLPLLLVDRDF